MFFQRAIDGDLNEMAYFLDHGGDAAMRRCGDAAIKSHSLAPFLGGACRQCGRIELLIPLLNQGARLLVKALAKRLEA